MKHRIYPTAAALLLACLPAYAEEDELPPGNVSAAEMYSQEEMADQTISLLEESLTRIRLLCNGIQDQESAEAAAESLAEARKIVSDTMSHIVADPDLKVHVEALLEQNPVRKKQLSELMQQADQALKKCKDAGLVPAGQP